MQTLSGRMDDTSQRIQLMVESKQKFLWELRQNIKDKMVSLNHHLEGLRTESYSGNYLSMFIPIVPLLIQEGIKTYVLCMFIAVYICIFFIVLKQMWMTDLNTITMTEGVDETQDEEENYTSMTITLLKKLDLLKSCTRTHLILKFLETVFVILFFCGFASFSIAYMKVAHEHIVKYLAVISILGIIFLTMTIGKSMFLIVVDYCAYLIWCRAQKCKLDLMVWFSRPEISPDVKKCSVKLIIWFSRPKTSPDVVDVIST